MYAYDYMDKINKLNVTKLPQKEKFYSKLSYCNVSDEDYEHTENVWKKFNMIVMGDYHDLYLFIFCLQMCSKSSERCAKIIMTLDITLFLELSLITY